MNILNRHISIRRIFWKIGAVTRIIEPIVTATTMAIINISVFQGVVGF